MLGQSKYNIHELARALEAINKGRKARSLTATKQEFITFIHATQNSQLDAEESMTQLRKQQALQGSSNYGAPDGKALDLISIGNMKLADFFMAYRRRSIMQLYINKGVYVKGKSSRQGPSSSSSSPPQEGPLPRKAPCPTLNPNPNPNPNNITKTATPKTIQSERQTSHTTRFQELRPLQAPSPVEPSSPFAGTHEGPASSSSQPPSLPQINTSASIHRRRSMGALPISSSKRFTTMTDLMNEMGSISLVGGSQRGASMMRQSQGGRSGLGSDDATDEEDLSPSRALVRQQEAGDGIATLHQLRKAAALNASRRRSQIAMNSSPAMMPRTGSESSMKCLPEAESGSILGLQGRSQSQNLVLPYILQEASSPSLSRAGSQDLDPPSPCKRKRGGMSNCSPLLRQPSKSQVSMASDQALDSKKKLERFRSNTVSSEQGLFHDQVANAVTFPRENFDILTACYPERGVSFSVERSTFSGLGSSGIRMPSKLPMSSRALSMLHSKKVEA